MWITIDYIKQGENKGEKKRIVSNWQGVKAFMALNMQASEYREVLNYVADTFEQGGAWAGWQWDNGDMVEFYCPDNERLPITVEPVVINGLRKVVNQFVAMVL